MLQSEHEVVHKGRKISFDFKQFTDIIFGIHPNEDYGSFMRSRDLRRKAFPEELREVPKELSNYRTFDNLMEI